MTIPWPSVRLFRMTIHLWLVGYLLSALPAAEWLWDSPVSPPLPGPPGPFRFLTQAFMTWLPVGSALPALAVLLGLAIYNVFGPSRWWIAFFVWSLFTSLTDLAWLAASGGHQLISNVLFWSIFLPSKEASTGPADGSWLQARAVLGVSAFWIIRLQLLLAYGVTGIQKLTGIQWTHGYAMGIVATDVDYGPSFLAGTGFLLPLLTYSILAFQLGFPLAVWWRLTRTVWMLIGVCFHVTTGLCFGILDMGLAFLACYPIWFSQDTAVKWTIVPRFRDGRYNLRNEARTT